MAGDCTCGGGDCVSSCGSSGGSTGGCAWGSTDSCSGCGGDCSGANCGAGCGSACGGCGDACEGCTGGCGTSCNVACSVSCTGSCTGGCLTACGKQCTGQTQAENFAKLKLEKRFNADNIQFISDFVKYEVQRREVTPTSISFSKKEKLDENKINQILNNLEKIESTIDSSAIININTAVEKKRGLRKLGEDIISKATVYYNTNFANS